MEIEKKNWSEEAEKALCEALKNDGFFIKNEVLAGTAELWKIAGRGWLVTRVDGDELVLVSGQGIDAKEVISIFMQKARDINLKSCRIHSSRRGMKRYLKRLGFEELETVYTVSL